MNDILNVISGTTDNIELLDVIRSQVGDDPQKWLPEFHKRTSARRTLKNLSFGASAPIQGPIHVSTRGLASIRVSAPRLSPDNSALMG